MISIVPWRVRILFSKVQRYLVTKRQKRYIRMHPKPIVAVTGSVGKTTTCRMLSHILSAKFGTVGVSGTQGLWINDELVKRGDHSGGYSALHLMNDENCQVVVAEFARGGLISSGLVLDSVDIGVFLNVYDNHLGLKGIETREQLGDLKSQVIMKARHAAIINADDANCMRYYSSIYAKLIYLISRNKDNDDVKKHMINGGRSVVREDGRIVLYHGVNEVNSINVDSIPDGYNGNYLPGVVAAMNAFAVADSLEVSSELVRERLQTFRSSVQSNPGRMNQVQIEPYELWLTWADGPEAMREIASFFEFKHCLGRKIIMLAPMGNRSDEFLRSMASQVVNTFSYFICSDWKDLRGRKAKEAACLIAEELVLGSVDKCNIYIANNHEDAVRYAFSTVEENDLILFVTMSGDQVLSYYKDMSLNNVIQ